MDRTDSTIATFGPFRLCAARRELHRDGRPVMLGDRALDILIALVDRAGEIVSHRELNSRVWRGMVVAPGNLRVHISALRHALGEDAGSARYIQNVTGQGYCFVAPIKREPADGRAHLSDASSDFAHQRLTLPPKLARMVGRDEIVASIAADLFAERFVTIIGPGGMGKTTVAIAVAHAIHDEFTDGVCFVDVSAVEDATLVSATIATSLGLALETTDALPSLLEYLRSLKILLVLDNCEHVIDVSATLAEKLFNETSGVHILATSREALRVEGEHARWLPALASPPSNVTTTASEALKYPAVQLFMERASASGARIELDDVNAPLVAGICDKLDGMALAIELAAGRVGSYGIAATAELVSNTLGLDWHGRRTALPRHQTLRSLFDWSYGMLAEADRRALRHLSVLIGWFSVEAASAIMQPVSLPLAGTLEILDTLVSKSLVSVESSGESVRYRLLETTRAYAREKLLENAEGAIVARRHAEYFTALLNLHHGGYIDLEYGSRAAELRAHLGNVRAALDWCFVQRDHDFDSTLAVTLAAAAVPMLFELSLLSEAMRWSAAGLAALDDTTRGDRRELILTTIWAISSMWVHGSEEVLSATARGMQLALALEEPAQRLRLQATRHMILTRTANFRASLAAASDFDVVARQANHPACLAISDLLQAQSHHYLGDQAAARAHMEAGFARADNRDLEMCGMDQRMRARVAWSRVLWLSGFPDRAVEVAHQSVDEAMRSAKPLNTCFALLFSTPMYLWRRDWDGAERVLDRLVDHTHWNVLEPFHATALAMQGATLIGRGEAEQGVAILLSLRGHMGDECLNFMASSIACFLAEGLTALGRANEAVKVIHGARRAALHGGAGVQLPELLRVEAEALERLSQVDDGRVVRLLQRSCRIAEKQSAPSWQLRSSIALARIYMRGGAQQQALRILAPIYQRFSEGFETRDLKVARQMLQALEDSGADQRSMLVDPMCNGSMIASQSVQAPSLGSPPGLE